MLRKIVFILIAMSFVAVIVYKPAAVSEPGPSPTDPAKEDISRIAYPSQAAIPWSPCFIRPQDSLEALFGEDWIYVARFNRIDRRHVYPGMTIKVPKDMAQIRDYCPLPAEYEPARHHDKYILVSLTEQWLGAYEYGKLKFSMPAATGMDGHNTPTGVFHVDARDKNHASSLYKTEDQQEQYPMDNAFRFHIGPDNVSYWIHARDLPGKPASHGCIGVYDEAMQHRQYGIPQNPVLLDSEKLYHWAVGECRFVVDPDDGDEDENEGEGEGEYDAGDAEGGYDSGALQVLENGPVVEVVGNNPTYKSESIFSFLHRK